ncbi:RNA polymerase sigma factor [Amycolatopsis vancoresmycina]|uniref:Sigma-70 family RNA polymerase n=1 Tax=Amycolatopsis vancoresmycina DSM 44592 TaxID=1292037 RepID=R1I327_9PSEU|nr:sigma-70 family RNA polymerase sigma factor [Amycolatopsis vancoresmycina]EOD70220.1 sigma-70 family RNA polymerase [Amycolatopsis vancoresmycina DSM 44592]
MPDEEQFANGDSAGDGEVVYPGGFDDFFRAEYRELVKALMVMEGASLADADDCAAHAMEKVLERWDLPVSDPGRVRHPKAYAMKTARHRLNSERRRRQSVALDEDGSTLPADSSALTTVEDRQFVAGILACLPPAQRQVMHLITEGYTVAEIAEVLNKKTNNVRQIVHLGKKRLRPLWGPPPIGSPEEEEER